MKKHLVFIGLILLFSLWGARALFAPGLFTAHDIWHQVARLYWYNQAFLDGYFPASWIAPLAKGFGYPLFMFSYHAPWIIAQPLLLLKIDLQTTIKILFLLSYLFSGIFMYAASYTLLKNKTAALATSIVYIWAPQRFLSIFVAAQMGVCFVYLFLPILIWGIFSSKKNGNKAIILTSLGLTGIILSHLASFLSLVPLIIILCLYSLWISRGKNLLTLVLGFALGAGLASFYLIPLIAYSPLTQISTTTLANLYKNNFVNLSQLLYSKWGYGPIVSSAKEGAISFQLGIAQWLSFAGIIIFNLFYFIKKRKPDYPLLVFSLIFLLSILMLLSSSQPIWDIIKKILPIDYPFRFVIPATFIGSLFTGILLAKIKGKLQVALAVIFVLIALYTNRNHIRVNLPLIIPTQDYVNAETTTNSYNEYAPKEADLRLLDNEKNSLVAQKNIQPKLVELKTNSFKFEVETAKPIEITINHFSFPGITLYLNKTKTNYQTSADGRILAKLTTGKNLIEVKFEDTPLMAIAKTISLISLAGLMILGALNLFPAVNTRRKISI